MLSGVPNPLRSLVSALSIFGLPSGGLGIRVLGRGHSDPSAIYFLKRLVTSDSVC